MNGLDHNRLTASRLIPMGIGHAIRKIMDPGNELLPALNGIVELDEKYVGGKPRYQKCVIHPRGKGTKKQ